MCWQKRSACQRKLCRQLHCWRIDDGSAQPFALEYPWIRKPIMIKRRFFCVALLGLCGALVCVTLLVYEYARADVLGGPLPAPRMPRDIIPLTPVEKLGKLMLYDSTLSNPPGYSCATCHVAETGYTGQNSEINAFSGPQPGVVPGRYSDRKPQSYLYAAFSPRGPLL